MTEGNRYHLRLLDRPAPAPKSLDNARANHPAQGVRRRPVLYISGEAHDRVLFTRIAKRWESLKLLVATNGREGPQVAVDRPLRMVVLDTRLPDVDAEALMGAIRDRAMSRSVPIVVLAHDSAPTVRARFVWAGASAYLAKPLNVAEIDQTVAMLLEVATLR